MIDGAGSEHAIGAGVVGPPFPHVLETEIDGDISLYDPRSETVLVLNGVASDIWRLCDGDLGAAEIVTLLAHAYETPEEEIRDDVLATLGQFVEEGVLPAP